MKKRILLLALLVLCAIALCSCSLALPSGVYVDPNYPSIALNLDAEQNTIAVSFAPTMNLEYNWQEAGASFLVFGKTNNVEDKVYMFQNANKDMDEYGQLIWKYGTAMLSEGYNTSVGSFNILQQMGTTQFSVEDGTNAFVLTMVADGDDSRIEYTSSTGENYAFAYVKPVVIDIHPVGVYTMNTDAGTMLMTLYEDNTFIMTGRLNANITNIQGVWSLSDTTLTLSVDNEPAYTLTYSPDGTHLSNSNGLTFRRK